MCDYKDYESETAAYEFQEVKHEIEDMVEELKDTIFEKYGFELEYTDIYLIDIFKNKFCIY